MLCSKPAFIIFNQKSDTEIHTDASTHGYGCSLLQKAFSDNCQHPVYYISKKTCDTKKKHTTVMNSK